MDPLGWVRDAHGATVDTGHDPLADPSVADPCVTDLSVVIPCRDGADVLPRQLGALAAQQWPGSWEVIVADNGSTDSTRAVAAAYADQLPALRLVDASQRPGRHHACNVGAEAARGAGVVFVDADDEVAPGYVAAMATALRDHAFVVARLDHVELDPEWMDGVGSGVQTTGPQDALGFLPHGAGASLGFQKAAFEAVGGFREHATYCEDVDICWRAQLAGYALEFVPDAVVRYRSRPTVREMFSQHRNYGHAQVLLFRDYHASGMARRPSNAVLGDWWAIVRGIPRCRSIDARARWSRRAGRCVGRVQGSLRYRVWYL